ncbi:MAG: SulP family inorganic anion transporter [Desulfobaccales bacterium]
MKSFGNLLGDLKGGITAAAVSLPQGLAYGLIAFSALGSEFASKSAFMGIYAAIFAGFMASLLGGNSIQITGPKAPVTIILASAISALMVKPEILAVPFPHRQVFILGLAAIMVFLGGLFQVIFGGLRLGTVIKYIPYPVISGFMNGIAFILITSQIKLVLGISHQVSYAEILVHPEKINILTLIVGLATLAFIPLSRRFLKAIPPPLAALIGGSFLFHFIVNFTSISSLGLEIGPMGGRWPRPDVLINLFEAGGGEMVLTFLPHLLSTAVILGLIGSMDTLLSSAATENLTSFRHNSNKELIGQGIGNITSSLFGALFSCGSVPRAMVNFKAGGRTVFSGMICSLALFLFVTIFPVLVEKIPLCVLGGIIIYIGGMLIDPWTISLLKNMATSLTKDNKLSLRLHKDILIDFMVILIVTIITASADIVLAVGIGVFIASIIFISATGNSIIRRIYSPVEIHSKGIRNLSDIRLFEQHGKQIAIFELSGPLFFGSAEILAQEIDNFPSKLNYCILDMKWLTSIDSTGANIILQIHRRMAREGRYLLISHATTNPSFWRFLHIMQVPKMIGENRIFPDTDTALAWAENHLLASMAEPQGASDEVPLEQIQLTTGTSPPHIKGLRLETNVSVDQIPLPAHIGHFGSCPPSSASRLQRYFALQGEYGPYCDQCQLIHGEEHRFCQRCGQLLKSPLRAAGRACLRCSTLTFQGQKYCNECGLSLRAASRVGSLVSILILLVGVCFIWYHFPAPSSNPWTLITSSAPYRDLKEKVETVKKGFFRQLHNLHHRWEGILYQKVLQNSPFHNYYVSVKDLSLREHPTDKAEIVKVLPFKSKLEKVDENSHGWIKVRVPETNITGWAHKEYFEASILKSPFPSLPLSREPNKGNPGIEPKKQKDTKK